MTAGETNKQAKHVFFLEAELSTLQETNKEMHTENPC